MKPLNENMNLDFSGGDEDFVKVFDMYYRGLVYFADKLLGNQPLAEDIVSDVFAKLWPMRSRFTNYRSIKAFLYTATRNACFNYSKHRKIALQVKKELAIEGETQEEGLFERYEADLMSQIYAEIEKLPENQRKVCILSFLEGHSNDEIAEKLDLSPQTVRNLKSIAVKSLQLSLLNKNLISIAIAPLLLMLI